MTNEANADDAALRALLRQGNVLLVWHACPPEASAVPSLALRGADVRVALRCGGSVAEWHGGMRRALVAHAALHSHSHSHSPFAFADAEAALLAVDTLRCIVHVGDANANANAAVAAAPVGADALLAIALASDVAASLLLPRVLLRDAAALVAALDADAPCVVRVLFALRPHDTLAAGAALVRACCRAAVAASGAGAARGLAALAQLAPDRVADGLCEPLAAHCFDGAVVVRRVVADVAAGWTGAAGCAEFQVRLAEALLRRVRDWSLDAQAQLLFDWTQCGERSADLLRLHACAPADAPLLLLRWWAAVLNPAILQLPDVSANGRASVQLHGSVLIELWSRGRFAVADLGRCAMQFSVRELSAIAAKLSPTFAGAVFDALRHTLTPEPANLLSLSVLLKGDERLPDAQRGVNKLLQEHVVASQLDDWRERAIERTSQLLDVDAPGGRSGAVTLVGWLELVCSDDVVGFVQTEIVAWAREQLEQGVAVLAVGGAGDVGARIAEQRHAWQQEAAKVVDERDNRALLALCRAARQAKLLVAEAAKCPSFVEAKGALQALWRASSESVRAPQGDRDWWTRALASFVCAVDDEQERLVQRTNVRLSEALDGTMLRNVDAALRVCARGADVRAEQLFEERRRAFLAARVLVVGVLIIAFDVLAQRGGDKDVALERVFSRASVTALRAQLADLRSVVEPLLAREICAPSDTDGVVDVAMRCCQRLRAASGAVSLRVLDQLLDDARLCLAVQTGGVDGEKREHFSWLAHVLLRPALLTAVCEQVERHGDLTQRMSLMAGSERLRHSTMQTLSALANVAAVLRGAGGPAALDARVVLAAAARRCEQARDAVSKLAALRSEQVVGLVADLNAVGKLDDRLVTTRDQLRATQLQLVRALQPEDNRVIIRVFFERGDVAPRRCVALRLLAGPECHMTFADFASIETEHRMAQALENAPASTSTSMSADLLFRLHAVLSKLLRLAAFGTAQFDDARAAVLEFSGSQLKRTTERLELYAKVWDQAQAALVGGADDAQLRAPFPALTRAAVLHLLTLSPQQLALAVSMAPTSAHHGAATAPQLAAVLALRGGLRQLPPLAGRASWLDESNWLKRLLRAGPLSEAAMRSDVEQALVFVATLIELNSTGEPLTLALPSELVPFRSRSSAAPAAPVWLVSFAGARATGGVERLHAFVSACALLSISTKGGALRELEVVDGACVLWCGDECGEIADDEHGALSRFVSAAASSTATRLIIFPSRLSSGGVDALVRSVSALAAAAAATSAATAKRPRLVLVFRNDDAARAAAAGSAYVRVRNELLGAGAEITADVDGAVVAKLSAQFVRHMVGVTRTDVVARRTPQWRYGSGKSTAISDALQRARLPLVTVPMLQSTDVDDVRHRLREVVSKQFWLQLDACDAAQGARIDSVLFDLLVLGRVTGNIEHVPASLLHGTKIHIEIADGASSHLPLSTLLLDALAADAPAQLSDLTIPRVSHELLARAERSLASCGAAERAAREVLLLRRYVDERDGTECLFDVWRLTQWLVGESADAPPHGALLFRSAAAADTLVVLQPEGVAAVPIEAAAVTVERVHVPRGASKAVAVLRDVVRAHVCGDEQRWAALMSGALRDFCLSSSICVRLVLMHALRSLGSPIVLLGETGCSKTQLVGAYAQMRGERLSVLDVHPAVSERDVVTFVRDQAAGGSAIVFVDEVNSAHVASLVKGAVVDGHVTSVHGEARLHAGGVTVIAACNPSRAEGGAAAYAVFPLPKSLRHFVVDCCALTQQTADFMEVCEARVERDALAAPARKFLCGAVRCAHDFVNKFVRAPPRRAGDDDASVARDFNAPPSLREIERVLVFFRHFSRLLARAPQQVPPGASDAERWLCDNRKHGACLLAVLTVYFYRLPSAERAKLSRTLSAACHVDVSGVTSCVLECVLRDFPLDSKVIASEALLENLHLLYVHTINRLPLMLVGEAGTSKSLSVALLARLVNERGGEGGDGERLSLRLSADDEPTIVAPVIQCSAQLSSAALQQQFSSWSTYGGGLVEDELVLLVLEEVGAAENLSDVSALKVLPALLDQNAARLPRERLAVVALSNSYLDAAKMNRATVVHRDAFDRLHTRDLIDKVLRALPGELDRDGAVASAFCDVFEDATVREDVLRFGLRDLFAALVDLRAAAPATRSALVCEFAVAFARHFGAAGRGSFLQVQLPKLDALSATLDIDVDVDVARVAQRAAPLCALREQLSRSTVARRHVLLLCDRQLTISQKKLLAECAGRGSECFESLSVQPFFGGVRGGFAVDELTQLQRALSAGRMLFVHGGRRDLYASLHDVFAAHDVDDGAHRDGRAERYARIVVGESSRTLLEAPAFVAVLSVTHAELAHLPPALVNRLQKFDLTDALLDELALQSAPKLASVPLVAGGRGIALVDPRSVIASFAVEGHGNVVDDAKEQLRMLARPFESVEAALDSAAHPLVCVHVCGGDGNASASVLLPSASGVIDAGTADAALTSRAMLLQRLRERRGQRMVLVVPLDVALYSDEALRLMSARLLTETGSALFQPTSFAVALMDELFVLLDDILATDKSAPDQIVVLAVHNSTTALTLVRSPCWRHVVAQLPVVEKKKPAARAMPAVAVAGRQARPAFEVNVRSGPVPLVLFGLFSEFVMEEIGRAFTEDDWRVIAQKAIPEPVSPSERALSVMVLAEYADRVRATVQQCEDLHHLPQPLVFMTSQWRVMQNPEHLLSAVYPKLPADVRERVEKRRPSLLRDVAPKSVDVLAKQWFLCRLLSRSLPNGTEAITIESFSVRDVDALVALLKLAQHDFEEVTVDVDVPDVVVNGQSAFARIYVTDKEFAKRVRDCSVPGECSLGPTGPLWRIGGARHVVEKIRSKVGKRLLKARADLLSTALCAVNITRAERLERPLLRRTPDGDLELVPNQVPRLVDAAVLCVSGRGALDPDVDEIADDDEAARQVALATMAAALTQRTTDSLLRHSFVDTAARGEPATWNSDAQRNADVWQTAVLLVCGRARDVQVFVKRCRQWRLQRLSIDVSSLTTIDAALRSELLALCVDVVDNDVDVAERRVRLASPNYANQLARARELLLDANKAVLRHEGRTRRPPTWTAADRVAVPVAPGSDEWRSVEARFRRDGFACTIAEIRRIQVNEFFIRFEAQVSALMETTGRPREQLERVLVHGTRANDPISIVVQGVGLHVMYAHAAGLYGSGVYFAENVQYSDGYAFRRPDGLKQMLVVNVLVGIPEDRQPDNRIRHPSPGFHSVRGQDFCGLPAYIVYDNGVFYATHLVTYR
jgi:hypothetical protein